MKSFLVLFMMLAPFSVGATTAADVGHKTQEAAGAAVDYTKEQKEAFQKQMEDNLAEIKKEIHELSEKASKKSGDAKVELKAQVKALEVRQEVLKKDLAKMKKTSGNAWNEMKSGVSKAWEALSDSYQKAKAEVKEETK